MPEAWGWGWRAVGELRTTSGGLLGVEWSSPWAPGAVGWWFGPAQELLDFCFQSSPVNVRTYERLLAGNETFNYFLVELSTTSEGWGRLG